jgi:hypothetical protein
MHQFEASPNDFVVIKTTLFRQKSRVDQLALMLTSAIVTARFDDGVRPRPDEATRSKRQLHKGSPEREEDFRRNLALNHHCGCSVWYVSSSRPKQS